MQEHVSGSGQPRHLLPLAALYHATERLRDGAILHVRSVAPGDSAELSDAFCRQRPDSIYARFLCAKKELSPAELDYFTRVDFINHVALVATFTADGLERGVGIARYIRLHERPHITDAAFIVDDTFQDRGIGKVLIRHLAIIARDNGVRFFEADQLSGNVRMLALFKSVGRVSSHYLPGGILHVSVDLHGTDSSEEPADYI